MEVSNLIEISLLVSTLGLKVKGVVEQKINTINPAYFIGSGKAKQVIDQAKMMGVDYIIFDEDLSPVQTKNFQKLNKEIRLLDRPGVILEIFFLQCSIDHGDQKGVLLGDGNHWVGGVPKGLGGDFCHFSCLWKV